MGALLEPRRRIAREAARLIYTGYEEEYIQAKERATRDLGLSSMPSNYEVAIELDRLADELEGWGRRERLIDMRRAALDVMRSISEYCPRLIGSVWRGTARRGSDIDISLYSNDVEGVKAQLMREYPILKTERTSYTLGEQPRTSHHIWIKVGEHEAEIVVRHPKDQQTEYCEIYGDRKSGLTLEALNKLMRDDPLRRFIPRRRGY
ncbi:MAG: hypothetical protein ACLFVP_05065 [Candidatus Bathyarchaeia archaeon]